MGHRMPTLTPEELANALEDVPLALPTKQDDLWVVMDGGNTDVKIMVHAAFGHEVAFPQYVRTVGAVDWKNLKAAYKNRRATFEGSAIFESNGIGYVVGQHASQIGDGVNRLGVDKYTREHMGSLLCAGLMMLYPGGHDSVNVVVTHPAKLSNDNLQALGRSIYGKHNLKMPNGDSVRYNVKQVIPIEESVAAFQTFVLTIQGRAYDNPRFMLKPNMQFLVIDIGGWISSIVPGIVTPRGRLEINRSAAMPIQVGIQNVTAALEPILKDKFPRLDKLQEVPETLVYEAIQTGKITISGHAPEDCSREVADAMQSLITEIGRPYGTRYGGGVQYAAIIVSGGGGGAAYSHLRDRLLEHEFAFTAEKLNNKMRFGAIRGASKGLITAMNGGQILS